MCHFVKPNYYKVFYKGPNNWMKFPTWLVVTKQSDLLNKKKYLETWPNKKGLVFTKVIQNHFVFNDCFNNSSSVWPKGILPLLFLQTLPNILVVPLYVYFVFVLVGLGTRNYYGYWQEIVSFVSILDLVHGC